MKILLVEDSKQLNRALSTVLKRNNYIVDCAFDGEEALILLEDYVYDVIILDIMLPKINGLEVLKIARNKKITTPILILSAKSTIEDKVTGLDLGADDYLAKPFEVGELLARIRALTRRREAIKEEKKLEFGDLVLNVETMVLTNKNENVTLMNKEMQILIILMENKGKIISQDELNKRVWDTDSFSTSENVWTFISYLRKKISSIHSKVIIKSIRYQGYYLEYQDD